MKPGRTTPSTFTLLPLTASHGLMHIMAVALPALSLLVKEEFHLTNTAVGMLSFAFAAAIGLGSIPAGLLSDRVEGLRLIRFGFLSTALLSALLLLSRDFLAVTLVFIAMGFFLSFYHPSALSHIARSFKARLGKTYGVHETGASIGLAITPLIAGFISYYYEWRFVYLFLAVPALFIAFLLFRKRKGGNFEVERTKQNTDAHSHVHTLKAFLREMIRTSSIRRVYLTEGLFGFVIGGALTFIPIFLNEAKGLSPEFAVVITSVFTAGGALGKLVGGHLADFVGEQKVMAIGFFLVAPLFFIVPFLPLFWAILALALAGLIFPAVLPAIISTISKEIELSKTGVAFGLLMLAGFGFGSISRPLMGVVGDSFGISTVFYPIVIVTLAGGLLNCTKTFRKRF
ncbi:MAG: MFS transporter [archaeon]|nr:MFS transporter [archaeon]